MKNLSQRLKGTGVAIATPFKKDLSVDLDSITTMVEFLIKNGIDYIVVQGTTGESSTLNEEEKILSRNAFIKANNNRIPLLIGIGSNDTRSVVNYISNTDLSGFCAVLSVTPFYNRPSQSGLFEHFSAISKSSPLPIILYNVPTRTGCDMDHSTTIKLANSFKNIIGIKEASGNMDKIFKLISNRPDGFLIISGDDETAYQSVLMGADGVISVAAGCIPQHFRNIINLASEGNEERAKTEYDKINQLLNLLFKEGNPTGLKAALAIKKLCQNHLRLPLLPSSKELYLEIENFFKK